MSRPLALTLGEPAGIGPDITLAVWRRRAELALPAFYILANPTFLANRAKRLGLDIPIAVVEPGFPVLLVGGGGSVHADLQAISTRLVDYGCRVVGLFDGASAPKGLHAAAVHNSGLPEELTPMTLVVLGQLLAHRVALARGVDPDQPRALRKITRTW